ncbi:MAG: DUF177 domain-containing protein [Chloroflexota bacterium]|nr:DUF177 domain-containing protein [Chloroflexota bacterium]
MKVEELKNQPFKGSTNVAELLNAPLGSRRSYDIDEMLDERCRGIVQGKLTLIHISRGILVKGELSAEMEFTCFRCLKAFLHTVNFSIEEEFLQRSEILNDPTFSSSGEPCDIAIDSRNMLDLGEIIRQYVILNLPMKQLCQPDCVGIKEVSLYGPAQEKIL